MAQNLQVGNGKAQGVIDSLPSFTVRRAVTPEDLELVYKLRYQVYGVERGFLGPEDASEGRECDEFDAHSIHFLAVDAQGTPIGTVRLVLNSQKGFPINQHCVFTEDIASLSAQSAEISRLAISKVFRKEAGGVLVDQAGSVSVDGVNRQCIVLMSLLRAMYQATKELGIEYWQVAMERSLFVLLKRQGMIFRAIGPEVDYHGRRTPYLVRIEDIEHSVVAKRPQLATQFGYKGRALQGVA
jgi:N-acyl amino acid synthase of PEP-CTERM/exosortase system